MLVTNRLASYEVPHELHWLIHVKTFNYAGLSGPTHFINVYLKSGGNHHQTRKEQLQVVKCIVAKIFERDCHEPEQDFVTIGNNSKTLRFSLAKITNMTQENF